MRYICLSVERRIEEIYAEYMTAIDFFKAMKELKENHDKQRNKGD